MGVNDVYPQVKTILADVLALDESEIEINKSLVKDLDAESIDFLDLIYRLEREFKIKIPRGQIEKEGRGDLSDDEFVQNGVLTAAGLEAMKAYLPEVPAEKFHQGLKVAELPSLWTVETLCKLVIRAQQNQSASGDA